MVYNIRLRPIIVRESSQHGLEAAIYLMFTVKKEQKALDEYMHASLQLNFSTLRQLRSHPA